MTKNGVDILETMSGLPKRGLKLGSLMHIREKKGVQTDGRLCDKQTLGGAEGGGERHKRDAIAGSGDKVMVTRDHDDRDGPCLQLLEDEVEGFDGECAACMPEVAEEEDGGVAFEGFCVGNFEGLDADGDGLALDVEVGENDVGALGFEDGGGGYVV